MERASGVPGTRLPPSPDIIDSVSASSDNQNLFHAGPSLSVVLMLLICKCQVGEFHHVHVPYLVQSSICELEHIDHTDDLASLAHNGQVQVVAI